MDRETHPQLPPLTALRSFEAAARHLSFTRAAGELSVTQAAVSHQVKLLEGHVGTPLFRRLARRIALTQAGQAWAAELRDISLAFTKQIGVDARRCTVLTDSSMLVEATVRGPPPPNRP